MKLLKIQIYFVFFTLVATSCSREKNIVDLSEYFEKAIFKNKGVVTSGMTFAKKDIKGFYVETDMKYRHLDGPNYLFEKKGDSLLEPPSGIRSSVPLGGFGAGSVELRADGRFMDWDIFNNSPATGNDKTQLDEAFMGLFFQSDEKNLSLLHCVHTLRKSFRQ